MAEQNRNCQDCQYIQGHECYQYAGMNHEGCGLVNRQWYKIEELIAALKCAGFSTTTTSSTTGSGNNCIGLLVEGYNNVTGRIGNAMAEFRYRLYKDSAKTNMILDRVLGPGINNVYAHLGPLDFDGPIYPDIHANVLTADGELFDSYGEQLDLIITANDMLIYARSIAVPQSGLNNFPALPELPSGKIKVMLFANRFDTNVNEGQGIVAIGGSLLTASIFTINTTMMGGGIVGSPELSWPSALDSSLDHVYTDFDIDDYGSHATSLQIKVSGTNHETIPLKVEYSFSADPTLDFSDTVPPGTYYEKSFDLTRDQAASNDILIRFLKS